MSDVRPVWLSKDDYIALRYILKASPGNADLKDWSMSMCERFHAAPSENIEDVIREAISTALRTGVSSTHAALQSLGYCITYVRSN